MQGAVRLADQPLAADAHATIPAMQWRVFVRKRLAKFGYRITRVQDGIGGNPFFDMAGLLKIENPTVIDVGANVGQTIERVRGMFPRALIHSFEPSPTTFETLKKNAARFSGVQVWNCALGASSGQMPLLENHLSEWTSFFPPADSADGAVRKVTEVRMLTLDQFCRENSLTRIDILKSDTQGYDLEVLKGGEQMFRQGAIGIVYCEIIFSDMYKNMPSFGHLYNFLIERDFRLASFYDIAYHKGLASWTDGVFVHRAYLDRQS